MLPFRNGELSFQVSNDLEDDSNNNSTYTNTNFLYQHKVEERVSAAAAATNNLLYQPHHVVNSKFKIPKTRKRRAGKSIQGNLNGDNNNHEDDTDGNDITNKKVIHREVERQRRLEMANLHSSLRSLLPMDYIKGKRSVSDHISEATRYIKDLEKNVKELGEKRDKLKDSISSYEYHKNKRENIGCSSSSSTASTTSTSSCSNASGYNVSIHKSLKTIRIEITAGVVEEDPYRLSDTLKVLAQQGLDVVSCVSSVVNHRWIYVIYCEVTDVTLVESCHLQEKLMSIISPSES